MYSPLEDRDALFRLVHLLPGSFSDDLKVQIVHVSFVHQTSQPQQARLSLNAVQKTLPQGWEVHESLQGRYIFQRHDPFWTTWTHPDPNVPRETWDMPDDPEFEPKYEALSYTWGSPNNRQSLQIVCEDGDEEPRELMIQESLSLALRHLRLADEVRTLWIDFLSINQGDLPECGFEVGRMSEIYKRADRVVVWLGPSSESSKGALSTLEAYAGQFELTRTNGSLPYPDSSYSAFPWPNCALDRTGQEIGTNRQLWEPIFDLLNRPWFDRLWVMQEIQLASKRSIMQCGLDSIGWPLFQRAVLCLRYQGNLRRDLASRLSRLVGLLSSARDCDFLRLLVKAQLRLCSEPRDKVYGILGLTPPRMRSLIHPTYREPVVSVYKDAFLALMKETNRLESLSLCMKQSGRLFERPSWVPDWSVSQHKVRHTANTVNLTSAFSSAQATLHSEDVLEVQGVQFGTVRDVKSPAPRTDMECIHSIYSWAPRDYPFDRYPNGEDLWDAFAATLLIDRVRSRFVHDIPSMQTASEWGEALRHHSLGALLELSGSGAVNEAFSLKDSIQFVMGRAFVTTDDGIFALGPEATQPGDILCTILGCDENMILRPLGNNQFEVVGPCYAHAYSDGEALLGTVPQPWQVKFMHDRGSGLELASFYNQVTSETTEEDPRLWALPLGWRKIHRERTEDDPMSFSWFFHEERAELVNYDPRLLPDQLKDRGVAIRSFMLI